MSKIIGIDLGTTNSLVAVWQDGESKLIPNALGDYLTPSVVSIDEEGTVYVGKTAKERLAAFPDCTACVFKRYMGTSRKYKVGNKAYLPEELSAFVLRRLKEDAERYLGEPVEEAIISVPAYFNDMARNATKRAGALAGLKVERIINEPSATALACHKLEGKDATYLVFDFGGGTLDVSLVECFDNIVEIVAVSGDNQLGGQDFDDMMATYFIRKLEIDPAILSLETRALIRSSAEKCKRELTEKKTAEMVVNCPQVNGKLEISRKDVVTVCAELFDRMGKPVRKVLIDAKTVSAGIDKIILVGGSCKMPVVRQYLRHILNRDDIEVMYPDHMIALGCGTCAGIKEREVEIKDTILTDICPFSLGVNVKNEVSPERDLMSFIIQRNSPLPSSKECRYVTASDDQRKVRVGIYQGESMYVDENLQLGEIEVNVPPRPAGEVDFYVRYTYDINGVLEVNLTIPITGEKRRLVIVNEELGLTEAQIQNKMKEYEKLKMNPAEEEENKYIIAWAERLFMQCSGEYKIELEKKIQYFNYILMKDPYQIAKVRKYLTVFLAYVEKMTESCVDLNEESLEAGSWYEEDDEDEKEIDNLFRQWDDEEYGK